MTNSTQLSYVDSTSDPQRYERDWVPKVLAYRDKLDKSIKKESYAPQDIVPKSIDEAADVTTIPYQVLNDKEIEITDMPATELAKKIEKGELTAVETLYAFIKRATISHQLTHCVTDFFVEEGIKRAHELDEIFAKTGKTVGPLHGIPISLKEHFKKKGRVCHAGTVGLVDNIVDEDSITTQILDKAGAVFYVRTTEPQTLMHECSDNNITGRTACPYNTSLSPGGSSSGEGALVSMGGSAIGVGTDIGGSIRAPAAFCGCWGLRPTTKRISMAGCVSALDGQETVYCSMGPFARSCADIDLFMKSYIAMEPWQMDASLVPLPWKKIAPPKLTELRIAIMHQDGVVRPHPPIERALSYAEAKLKSAGVDVVTWEPYRCLEAFENCLKAYTADGNFKQKRALALSGEPVLPLSQYALSMGLGDKGLTVVKNHELNVFRDTLRDEYLQLMNDKKVDFILSPASAGTAPRPGTIHYWNYCSLWNILDMPGIVFPTGLFQDPTVDVKDNTYTPRNEFEKYEYGLYEPEFFKNAPLCVQLTGRRYQDESLVKAAEILETAIRN